MQITRSSIWVCPWPLLSLRKPSPILGDQPTPVSGFPTLVEKWQMMSLLFSSILLPVYWVSLTAKVSLKASSHVNWKNHRHGAVVVLVQPTVLPDWKLAFRRKAFPIWLIFGCLEKLQVGQHDEGLLEATILFCTQTGGLRQTPFSIISDLYICRSSVLG